MMSAIVAHANSSRSLSTELLEPDDAVDAACIARAIAQRMDPEWREFVAQEQFERMIASFRLSRSNRSHKGWGGRCARVRAGLPPSMPA